MRTSWILFVFPILLSLGLLMVILGQFQEMDMINKKGDELQELSKTAYNRLQYEANFKKALDDLLVKGKKSIKDLEAALVDFAPQLDSKKTESLSCQEQMVKMFAFIFLLHMKKDPNALMINQCTTKHNINKTD